jgi:hypothetical protein
MNFNRDWPASKRRARSWRASDAHRQPDAPSPTQSENEHAYEAQTPCGAVANRDCYREQALHHQSMAKFHAERAWVGLLSLLLIDPII